MGAAAGKELYVYWQAVDPVCTSVGTAVLS